jgi:hypothetical protein
MNTQLYINNQPLSISKDVEILLTYSVIDIDNIEERYDAASYLMNIEATEEVRKAFNFPDYITNQDAIRLSKSYTAKVINQGNTLIDGLVKFSKVIMQGNKLFYEFYIVGSNNVWANELRDKRLRNLDLWEYSHEWTQSNQENAETPMSPKPYVYPLINGKVGIFYVHDIELHSPNKPSFLIKGEVYPSDFSGKDITLFNFAEDDYNTTSNSYTVENNYDGNGNSRIIVHHLSFIPFDDYPYGYIEIVGGNSRLRATDRFPMLRISDILAHIFRGIGYNLKSFFTDNILSKKYTIYEYFSGHEGQLRFQENFKFRSGIIEDKTISNPTVSTAEYKVEFDNTDYQINFDPTSSFDASLFAYAPKITVVQAFYFALRFEVLESSNLQFFVVVEDNLGNKSYQNGVALTFYPVGTYAIQTETFSYIEVPTTSKVYVIARFFSSAGTVTFLKGNCRFENRPRFTPVSEGDMIHLMQFLPDWSQLEYVGAIIKHFQLVIMTDKQTRTVYIEDYDHFYDREMILDWSDKIDTNLPIEYYEIEKENKSTLYKYKDDDNDSQLKFLKDTFNTNVGSEEVANDSLFKNGDIETIEFDFAPTIMSEAENIGITEMKIPLFNLTEFGISHEVRILHYDNLQDLATDTLQQGSTTRTDIPHAFFYDDINENYNSLSFADEPNTIGLITKHFKPFLNEQQQGEMIKVFLTLSVADVAGFTNISDLKKDFRSLILLQLRNEKILFRLNSINQFDPTQTAATECELVQMLPSRFLPTYSIAVFEILDIETIFDVEAEELTVNITVKNAGSADGTVEIDADYRGDFVSLSQSINAGQTEILTNTFAVEPKDFGGGLILPVESFPGTLEWIYFGNDFVKSHWFIY